jgi:hypothetical protein
LSEDELSALSDDEIMSLYQSSLRKLN